MYTVREVGKSGGTKYPTYLEAWIAARDWFRDTGIRCVIVMPHGTIVLAAIP